MPYLMKVLQHHPLMSDNITYTCVSASIQESDKLLVHPHPDLEQHEQEVKVIWQNAPHGGPIPRLGVTPGGLNLYHWIPGVGVPISVP